MKKKRNGFMLAELIITSTIVVSAMISLYASFNKIYSLYKTKNNYYYVDGVYATKELTDSIIKDNFNTFINNKLSSERNTYLIKDNTCETETNLQEKCKAIQELYHVKNMIFAEYNKCNLDKEKCTTQDSQAANPTNVGEGDNTLLKIENNQPFKEYIDYVIDYYDIESESNEYNYIVLTEIEEDGQTYYSNLRIR